MQSNTIAYNFQRVGTKVREGNELFMENDEFQSNTPAAGIFQNLSAAKSIWLVWSGARPQLGML